VCWKLASSVPFNPAVLLIVLTVNSIGKGFWTREFVDEGLHLRCQHDLPSKLMLEGDRLNKRLCHWANIYLPDQIIGQGIRLYSL
jgi:hypothetical protein